MSRYIWTNGHRTISVDASSLSAARDSFHDIVAKYYPDTVVSDWVRS